MLSGPLPVAAGASEPRLPPRGGTGTSSCASGRRCDPDRLSSAGGSADEALAGACGTPATGGTVDPRIDGAPGTTDGFVPLTSPPLPIGLLVCPAASRRIVDPASAEDGADVADGPDGTGEADSAGSETSEPVVDVVAVAFC